MNVCMLILIFCLVSFSNVGVHTGWRITACGVETQTHLSHAVNLVILNDLFDTVL